MGPLGGMLSAQGYDRRILIKEFFGEMALELARAELTSIAKLQSNLLANEESAQDGSWYRAASARSASDREDNNNVARLMLLLKDSPFVGIIGEVRTGCVKGGNGYSLCRVCWLKACLLAANASNETGEFVGTA